MDGNRLALFPSFERAMAAVTACASSAALAQTDTKLSLTRAIVREASIRKVPMSRVVIVITALLVMEVTAMADKVNFDADAIGSAPAGWTVAKTGKGDPKWTVEEDPTSPSKSGGQAIGTRHLPASAQKRNQCEGWLCRGSVQSNIGLGGPRGRPRLARSRREQLLCGPRQRA
jgi:hypothetical protein